MLQEGSVYGEESAAKSVSSGYHHRRSLVESKMPCFKRLGQRLMARTFERQVVEVHVRVGLLDRFMALGTPNTVVVPTVA